jgi:hypothetical protein
MFTSRDSIQVRRAKRPIAEPYRKQARCLCFFSAVQIQVSGQRLQPQNITWEGPQVHMVGLGRPRVQSPIAHQKIARGGDSINLVL